MPTAIEILSKIFDKDGVKYTKIKNITEKIEIDSNICDIDITKSYKSPGYDMTVNCEIKNDIIKRNSGAASFVERFEILRDSEQGLFIFGHSNESMKRAGEVAFIATTKTKYPHLQIAEIKCDNDKCQLIKGRDWED